MSTPLRLPFLGVGVGSGGGATSYGFAAYPADGVLEGPDPYFVGGIGSLLTSAEAADVGPYGDDPDWL